MPLPAPFIEDMVSLGFLMRGEIIWNKASSASPSMAWGTWLSAANPVLRDIHEYILIFSKDTFTRKKTPDRINTITGKEFMEFTKSVWTLPAVSARKIGHPAPFPTELPRRLIEFYSFKDDVVLDPFCGSGSTCLAARLTGRHYIGYDIDPEYVSLATKRIEESKLQLPLIGAEVPVLGVAEAQSNINVTAKVKRTRKLRLIEPKGPAVRVSETQSKINVATKIKGMRKRNAKG